MTMSDEMDKIIDDFYAVYDKYQEAIQTRDRQGIIKYGKELADYLGEHRKLLEISDEYINELNTALVNLEKTFTKAPQSIKPTLLSEADKQAYFQSLLSELPIGKRRTEH